MQIFQAEKEDNVDIQEITSEATYLNAAILKHTAEASAIDSKLKEALKIAVPEDSTLVHCVLVSTNWNRNDDVFTPDETWKARSTPIFKPANKDHNGKEKDKKNQTFGVIVNSQAIDAEFNLIQDGPPPYFHILTSVQLWEKYWPTAVEEIKTNIDAGVQYVSMECATKNFGYALREPDSSKIYLLDRNEKTSKLTKYLRAYKGKGIVELNGKKYQIGRWLKDIIFTGIGFVDKPANPESIVFDDYISHASIKEHGDFIYLSMEDLEQEISDNLLKNSVLDNNFAKGDEMDKETKEIKEVKANCEDPNMKDQMAALQNTIAELSKANADLVAKYSNMEAEAKKCKADAEAAQTALAAIEKARITEARFTEMKECDALAGIDADENKAKEALANMSVETYASVLNMAKASYAKMTALSQSGKPKLTDQTQSTQIKSTDCCAKVEDNTETLAAAKVEVKEDISTVVVAKEVPNPLFSAMSKLIDKNKNKKS